MRGVLYYMCKWQKKIEARLFIIVSSSCGDVRGASERARAGSVISPDEVRSVRSLEPQTLTSIILIDVIEMSTKKQYNQDCEM